MLIAINRRDQKYNEIIKAIKIVITSIQKNNDLVQLTPYKRIKNTINIHFSLL